MNIGELAFWSKATSLVRNTVDMARASEHGWSGPEMDKILERLARDIGESPAAVRDQLKANAQEATRVAVSLGHWHAAGGVVDERPKRLPADSPQGWGPGHRGMAGALYCEQGWHRSPGGVAAPWYQRGLSRTLNCV